MKKIIHTIVLIVVSVLFSQLISATPLQKELHSGWKFKQARLVNWYPATVPGVIHTDLIANQLIEDPFFRLNEKGVQWVDKEDWIYETIFDIPEEMFSKENIILFFQGLDTYADVYLNEEKVLSANNMFREWKINIKGKAKEKENRLRIYFHSPIKIDMPKWEAAPVKYEANNDQSYNGGIFNRVLSVYARKAGYHYGWDWGPRLVTSGIWRPVYLEAWNDLRLQDVFIQQPEVSAKKAVIQANIEILSDKDIAGAVVTIKNEFTQKAFASLKTSLKKGLNTIEVNFTIKNPRLWWSNGLGEPYLYAMTTEVATHSTVMDSQTKKVGIRSLKVINQPDEYGKSLYLELNGIPVFAKGANYIPCDNFLPRVTQEIYERTILDAVNANMNTLRVWGGGIYENDVFYELCDQYGIMIWQDFMFACALYPAEGELLENIKQEAIDNIKRLRNHACMALWCGNNEVHDAWYGWGWGKRYIKENPEQAAIILNQYDTLFNHLLPDLVSEYAPQIFYWPSSPYYEEDKATSPTSGDRHSWNVWHASKPISDYNKEKSRFFSEYGFQSFPEFESVKKYAPYPEDHSITSEVMLSHQRGGIHANELIEEYLLKEYRQPKDFEAFLYMNQVLQGDAIKTAIEAHRRLMPYCMGSLYWQHNDCWPVASWSSRDYYGRWKAQHYFAREAFDNILVSPILNEENLEVYIISDELKDLKGQLTLKIQELDGKIIYEINQEVKIPANASIPVFSAEIASVLKNAGKEDVFVSVQLKTPNNKVYKNNYFLDKQKNIRFPQTTLSRRIKPIASGYEITLTSDKFSRAVFLSLEEDDHFFENNYFDILPGENVTVRVKSKLSRQELEKQLKVISLREAY
ncbi:beta-mannosidase [Bacteroidia bacterium]|nr:beta-mannosidase [Bacteroidia bacterium]